MSFYCLPFVYKSVPVKHDAEQYVCLNEHVLLFPNVLNYPFVHYGQKEMYYKYK